MLRKDTFPLLNRILEKSHSKVWLEAVKEWEQVDVYEADEPETCLCGHFPIIEVCVIQNKLTKEIENVGNCCVKRFLGLRPDMIVKSIKKIKEDISLSVNIKTLNYSFKLGYINKKDYDFYADTWRKRVLSGAQEKWRIDINKRIIKNISLIKKII